MTTKVFSASNGKARRFINRPTTDERILQLHRQLGMSAKDAAKELKWLNVKIASKAIDNRI